MILNVNTKPLNLYGVPDFTYTGTYEIVDDNNNVLTDMKTENWRIRFLTSGNLVFTKLKGATRGIDVFIVGGGASGYDGISGVAGGGGGGGGYISSQDGVILESKSTYKITIGGSDGNTSAFSITANCGGKSGTISTGGPGTGKGGNGSSTSTGGSGGPGIMEFGVGPQYYGGGGGGGGGYYTNEGNYIYSNGGSGGTGGGGKGGYANYGSGTAGTKNTGGGGGGGGEYNGKGATGGSGIVIIRNSRS